MPCAHASYTLNYNEKILHTFMDNEYNALQKCEKDKLPLCINIKTMYLKFLLCRSCAASYVIFFPTVSIM